MSRLIKIFALLVSASLTPQIAFSQAKFEGIGRIATPQEIKGWDTAISPSGRNLPEGEGTAKLGEPIYIEKCAACHGEFGESNGRFPLLSGGKGTLKSHDPVKSIGSYWAYATTLLDYTYRAMPYGQPQTLTPNELYSVTAYVLSLDDLVKDDFVLNKKSLLTIKMPNANGFFDDDREKSEKHFWQKTPCMKDCFKSKAEITMRARNVDVTPEGGASPKQ